MHLPILKHFHQNFYFEIGSSQVNDMKNNLYILSLFFVFFLSGCSLFGWYMNGDPNPRLTTEMQDWTKSNINEEQRQKDWISCGGNSAGHVEFTQVTHKGSLTYEDGIRADKEYDAAQACMMKNGYHYTGKCRGPMSGRYACKSKKLFQF